jgi:hypothetical protein
MSAEKNTLFVLRVAVTGHRDLIAEQNTDIRRLIGETLTELTTTLPAAQIELVTGMADGADQLVSDVAREMGCRIHIVLPKPAEEYRRELSDEGVRNLDAMMSAPRVRVSTVAADQGPPTSLDGVAAESASYDRLGRYLVRSSHALIALWDGRQERKPGGTFDVVARFLDGTANEIATVSGDTVIENAPERAGTDGPTAVWIQVDRSDAATRREVSLVYLTASGRNGRWWRSDEPPEALRSLTADLATLADSPPPGDVPQYPLVDRLPADLAEPRRTALEELHAAYLAADGLAVAQQRRSDSSFLVASVIAAAMGFCFLWFAKIDDHLVWLYAYLGLFAVGYVVYRAAHSGHWLRRHLSMRALAETLRVRFFATMLGLTDDVQFRRVLRLTGVGSFPGFAVVGASHSLGVPTGGSAMSSEAGDVARRAWVDDQAVYFERRSHRLHRRHEQLEIVQRLLYVLSFAAVVAIIAFGSDLKKVDLPGDVSTKTFIIFLMGLLPLWLTLWELHQGRLATGELLWQFRNQAQLFLKASGDLDAVADPVERDRIYVELAERSLFETYLWTIHRFHREFSPPSGG